MKKVVQEHLPKSPQQRKKIITSLQDKLNELQNHEFDDSQQLKNKQQILKQRIKLIADCNELSVERIEHLQQIFKHYCTHIFKIGKHMTFQRLQYEKVHLTLDRFCVFLKDFSLTVAQFQQQSKEIIEKNQIVKIFKRLSSNCRDLSFQQFIASLQKLAPLHYDGKLHYHEKVQQVRETRDKRIALYKSKMKKLSEEKKKSKLQKQQGIEEDPEEEDKEDKQDKEDQGQQNNNKLVEDMMKDENLENPINELDQNQKKDQKDKSRIKSHIYQDREYQLTLEEKVQVFYQMIGVDNVKDFRKKMGELNLPIFKKEHKKVASTKKSAQIHVVIEENQEQDTRRLIQLRQKLNKKRERDKIAHSPVMSKEDYEQRKRKRQMKQTDQAREMMKSRQSGKQTTQVKIPQKKKLDLTQREVSLDMINHLSFDELKYKFDPKKYIVPDNDDNLYLGEYGSFEPKTQKPKVKNKTNSTMQVRKRTSSNIVEDFKRRAEEIQKNQFNREAKLTKFMHKIKNNQKILAKF